MTEPMRVSFRKQVSDGNYGSEVAEAQVDAADASEDAIAAALMTARRLVHEELRHSPSGNVRRALEYPKPIAAGAPADDLEDLPY